MCGFVLGVVGVAGCGEGVAPRASQPGAPGASSGSGSGSGVVRPARVPHDACADDSAVVRHPVAHLRWQREKLPAGFEPVLLITCEWQERTTAHDGEWTFRVEKRATSGLDAVVAALRSTPPPPPTGSYGCDAVLRLDPWFLLVDRAGRVVLPVVPHDRACDQPIDVGLSKLHFTEATAKRVQQQSTAAELASSCADRWKNEPRISADMHDSHPATSRVVVSSTPVSVCTYRSTSGDPEVGAFMGGSRLSSRDAARIGRLMRADPPGVGVMCPPVTDYAVVHTADNAWTYVDLSGCEVMFIDGGSTWTSPVPDLVRAIKDLHLQK